MTAVLEVDSVSKTFTRTQALVGVSMTIQPGEVHALLGQNGSGKSTLIKILSGYHAPDPGGGIRIGGNELPFQAPVQSYRLGCRFVQQDLGLVGTLSVEDNMSLGSGFPTAFGTIRDRASRAQARADLAKLNLDIDPKAMVSSLAASERTGVAIARALREDPEYPAGLLVLDEPTATLPVDEVDHLLDRVAAIAATGVGVLYVTHHLGEVFRVAQKVSVFRDGKVVGAGPVAGLRPCLDRPRCSPARSCSTRRARPGARRPDVRRPARTRRCSRSPISTPARRPASRWRPSAARSSASRGWPAPAATTCSARPSARCRATSGEVKVAGKPLPSSRPDVAIGQGVAYVAPDRKTGGCVMTMSARENLTLPDLKPFWKGGVVRRKAEKARTREWFERLSVRPANATEEPLSIFSGGNQQKILFGKWLSQKPTVFLLDEPTQGVDVGAKADLHRELVTVAEEGAAVLISSSDLEELADLCDRVLVIVDGKISSVLEGAQLTQSAITRSFMPLAAEPVDAS